LIDFPRGGADILRRPFFIFLFILLSKQRLAPLICLIFMLSYSSNSV